MKRIFLPLLLAALCVSAIAITTNLANPTINTRNLKADTPMITMVIQSREKVVGGNTYLAVEYSNRPWHLEGWSYKNSKTLKYDFYPPEAGKATFTCALLLERHQFSSKKSFDLKGKTFIIVDADNKKIDIKP